MSAPFRCAICIPALEAEPHGPGGGMYTGPAAGIFRPRRSACIRVRVVVHTSGPGGGLYTGPEAGLHGTRGGVYSVPVVRALFRAGRWTLYRSRWWMYTGPELTLYGDNARLAVSSRLLREMGMDDEADIIAEALASIGWRG